jgi:hypothetical protein
VPPLASWYGEGAVGVSAPAPPLSFLRAERGAFSAAPLSGDRLTGYCCGVFAVILASIDCMRFFRNCQAASFGREKSSGEENGWRAVD